MTGGIAKQRAREPKSRGRLRRQYRAVLQAGELVCERGAWTVTIAKDGTPSEPAWDSQRRLYANLGDLLIVCGDDVAAMRIVEVVEPGWRERWRVEAVRGRCSDGRVLVMSAQGLGSVRRARKARGPRLRAVIAKRTLETGRTP